MSWEKQIYVVNFEFTIEQIGLFFGITAACLLLSIVFSFIATVITGITLESLGCKLDPSKDMVKIFFLWPLYWLTIPFVVVWKLIRWMYREDSNNVEY